MAASCLLSAGCLVGPGTRSRSCPRRKRSRLGRRAGPRRGEVVGGVPGRTLQTLMRTAVDRNDNVRLAAARACWKPRPARHHAIGPVSERERGRAGRRRAHTRAGSTARAMRHALRSRAARRGNWTSGALPACDQSTRAASRPNGGGGGADDRGQPGCRSVARASRGPSARISPDADVTSGVAAADAKCVKTAVSSLVDVRRPSSSCSAQRGNCGLERAGSRSRKTASILLGNFRRRSPVG